MNPRFFFLNQIRQLQRGGWAVLVRKFFVLLGMLAAVIPVLVVRALRPFVLIRFKTLTSGGIGHFSLGGEFYLSKKELSPVKLRSIDLFSFDSSICNNQLKKMYERILPIHPFVWHLNRMNRLIPGGRKHLVEDCGDRDVENVFARTNVHMAFTQEEIALGQTELRRWGVTDGKQFICFHARDSTYLKATYPHKDYSFYNHRDCDIRNYLPAMVEMAKRGYCSFRMGAVVKTALPNTDPEIIDYASKARTDFMDIFLSAHCRFFVASCSGIDSVAMAFRRPIVYANYIPIDYITSWGVHHLSIPKKIWDKRANRFLTFRELLGSEVGRFMRAEQYVDNGLEAIENTPEEITAATLEMEERLAGTWKPHPEDEELQQRFWSLVRPSFRHGVITGRMGADFLRQNRNLLD